MKEVTRIHIAKTSYDAETPAKKELEAYLKALEVYSGDTDILADVEVRITEILADRGVKKDGVITVQDVQALKEQLGEPQEFKTDDVAPDEEEIIGESAGRKLFRDTDHALVGGVLSGVAAFFGVNAALVRVIFILLMFVSFGTALLVYLLLWAVVPPARTAADKLQMSGRPVTIASIRSMNESMVGKKARMDPETQKSLLTFAGIVCVVAAVGTVLVTAAAGLAIFFNRHRAFTHNADIAPWVSGALLFAIASGLLLAVLFGILAYASFVRKMAKRTIVSICIVIVLGFLSFGVAVGITQYAVFKARYESPEASSSAYSAPRNNRIGEV